MKPIAVFLLVTFLTFVTSKPYPWKECNTKPPVFKKLALDITPDVIRQGTTMISRTNETSSEIVQGGTVVNQIFFLGVQVGTERFDICEATVGGCPIRIGPFSSLSKSNIPSWSPKGTYTVITKERDRNGREISCIEFSFKVE